MKRRRSNFQYLLLLCVCLRLRLRLRLFSTPSCRCARQVLSCFDSGFVFVFVFVFVLFWSPLPQSSSSNDGDKGSFRQNQNRVGKVTSLENISVFSLSIDSKNKTKSERESERRLVVVEGQQDETIGARARACVKRAKGEQVRDIERHREKKTATIYKRTKGGESGCSPSFRWS